jgi:phosphoribosylanthranilate isomerase
MTWVKICGTTSLEDALVAVEAGADAVGFVFYEKSPRNISVKEARQIVDRLPENVEKVGVFVNESEDRIRDTAKDASLSAVQVYGEASTSKRHSDMPELPINNFKLIVAVKSDRLVPGAILPSSMPGSMVHAILVDSGSGDRPGGTGETFDWGKSREYVRNLGTVPGMRVIVAGGLKPENVGSAIDAFAPWGVDVVSGVEASPGKKDPEKVRAFVRAVREFDRRVG